jgi:hypothetical protein
MKDDDRVFPNHFCLFPSDGITLPQYAAIKLRVPRSGDPDIDTMIRESRRDDFAEKAMGIIVGKAIPWPDSRLENDWKEQMSRESYAIADAMLAEGEKVETP